MKLSTRIIRLIAGTALVVLLLVAAFSLVEPWLLTWGATDGEVAGPMPGDGITPQTYYQHTQAITIDAPPETVWPWVVQMGQDRAGFYSYEWLEQLFACNIHNADRIAPEWQQRQVGDFVSVCEGVGGWWIAELEPARALVYKDKDGNVPVALRLVPMDGGRTRLLARMRMGGAPTLVQRVSSLDLWWTHTPMQRQMLRGIQARAEGRLPRGPAPAVALVLWLAALGAGLAAAGRVVAHPAWRRPLIIGLAAVLVLLVQAFLIPPLWVRALLDVALLAGLWWAWKLPKGAHVPETGVIAGKG